MEDLKQQLRLGNYVYSKEFKKEGQHIKKVVGITDKGIYVPYGNGSTKGNEISGIPITKDILINCGFTYKFNAFIYLDISMRSEIKEQLTFSIEEYSEKEYPELVGIWLENYEDFDVTNEVETQWAFMEYDLKYVHQLQNLYYTLTGKELEVKF